MDFIKLDMCDSCNKTRKGVMMHHKGTPIMFLCRSCQPRTYVRTYTQQKQRKYLVQL